MSKQLNDTISTASAHLEQKKTFLTSHFSMHRLRWLLAAASIAVLAAGVYLRASFFVVAARYLPAITDEALNMLMARDIAAGARPILFWTQPYQFPLEAYILSFFVGLLPPNAFGARIVLALICVVSLFGFAFIYYIKKASFRDTWPALALISIPSVYFTIRQVAFTIPQYTATITFAWLLPLMFVAARANSKREHIWAFPIGLVAGIALSVHLLSIGVVFMTAVAVCLGTGFRSAIKNTVLFLPGFVVGAIPYLIVSRLPDVYEKVTDTFPVQEALARMWDPILTKIVPVTLGILRCVFPDTKTVDGPFGFMAFPFTVLVVVGLLAATLMRAHRFFKLLRCKRWPALELDDLITGAIWLALISAAFAAFGTKYRYLLPLAWYFPFLLGLLYASARPKLLRMLIGGGACLLVAVNWSNTLAIRNAWAHKDFSKGVPDNPRLEPLLTFLSAHGIAHCYAPWWIAYRIPFESNGKIICSQSFNERFPGWKLAPLLKEVDMQQASAYVVSHKSEGLFNPDTLQRHLSAHGLVADRRVIGQFTVFWNIRHTDGTDVRRIAADSISLTSNDNQAALPFLVDAKLETVWSNTKKIQHPWIQLNFAEPEVVTLVRLYLHTKHHHYDAQRVNVDVLRSGGWVTVVEDSKGLVQRVRLADSFRFGGHPHTELSFGFPAVETSAIRIQITRGGRRRDWMVGEVEVLAKEKER